jgi:hypothetical protein
VNWDNWATIADLCTALGTLILAVATFSAVRSANLSARVAQASLLVGLRPVLMATRRDDPTQKVNFGDRKWVHIRGGGAVGEIGGALPTVGDGDGLPSDDNVIYLAMGLRNAGNGIAVLHGWHFYPEWHRDDAHAPLEEFRRQSRDLWVPPGDIGFWQGAFRDLADPQYEAARKAIETRHPWTIELLYGDHEGGQRCITRFTMMPGTAHPEDVPSQTPAPDEADTPESGQEPDAASKPWVASQSRYWNIDRPDPR